MREERTEVMVVGAGPVGLWTALLLADAGIETIIIDREQQTAARSYACALHPRTLGLLDRLGLAAPLVEEGRRVSRMAFYDRTSRRAEVNLGLSGGKYPFLLILPQSVFESALERRLREAGTRVRWNCRFDSFEKSGSDDLAIQVEELAGTSTGYIVPHWEMTVKNRLQINAQFLVGADGHRSLVRQRLGTESQRQSGFEFFAAYEFLSDDPGEDEVRVVLDEKTTNVLWPLTGGRFRWTFQLVQTEIDAEFPEKERRAVRLSQSAVDERIRQYVQRVASQRAPWFKAGVKEIAWCTQVAFEHRVVKEFGSDRCWLAGDAAHQTGPVGVQSMNAAFTEAEALVQILKTVLQQNASPSQLRAYSDQQSSLWQSMLGVSGGLKPRQDTDLWARDQAARILPCLPASHRDLGGLAGQLKMDYI